MGFEGGGREFRFFFLGVKGNYWKVLREEY